MDIENTPGEVTLAQKVAFLGWAGAWPHGSGPVASRETHMSWVFLVGDRVYKLKKPVRLPYLDYSTRARREMACRAEVSLNRRLAPDVYLAVAPLCAGPDGLAIGDGGEIIDWLVVMRRLDESRNLEHAIRSGGVETRHLDRVAARLARFYRRAAPVALPIKILLRDWRRKIAENVRGLLDARYGLPQSLVMRIAAVQRRLLARLGNDLARSARARRLVDGHGDLRPEHVWIDDPVRIIDCLEFSASMRAVDPLDELAALDVECRRLGAAWAGDRIRHRVTRELYRGIDEVLYRFYRSYRAMVRARLAVAHLADPLPRTPGKWLPLTRVYLRTAHADAVWLEQSLGSTRIRADR